VINTRLPLAWNSSASQKSKLVFPPAPTTEITVGRFCAPKSMNNADGSTILFTSLYDLSGINYPQLNPSGSNAIIRRY
jgi:hypothetical protein